MTRVVEGGKGGRTTGFDCWAMMQILSNWVSSGVGGLGTAAGLILLCFMLVQTQVCSIHPGCVLRCWQMLRAVFAVYCSY